jgi:two-component system response regulator ResD
VPSNTGVVLVVDDDADFRAVVRDLLADSGFVVAEAATAAHARQQFHDLEPAVVLLDLGLPDEAGLDLLVELTQVGRTPILVVSARAGDTDRATGLDLGADDYIVKPVAPRELVARVRAAIRRSRRFEASDAVLSIGSLMVNHATREVTVDGTPVRLTAREFDLLSFLARAPRQVFSRRQLLQQVWGSSPNWQDDGTVAEHVYRVRRKLDPDDRSRWIETVKGVGYRFTAGR